MWWVRGHISHYFIWGFPFRQTQITVKADGGHRVNENSKDSITRYITSILVPLSVLWHSTENVNVSKNIILDNNAKTVLILLCLLQDNYMTSIVCHANVRCVTSGRKGLWTWICCISCVSLGSDPTSLTGYHATLLCVSRLLHIRCCMIQYLQCCST